MNYRAFLAGCLMGLASLYAQPYEHQETLQSPRENAIEQLLGERESPEALNKAIATARAVNISEQTILEARFLFHVDREEDKEIAALLPEFIALKDHFKLADSEVFASADDWLAVTEYVHALAALEMGDNDSFKRHITEAFWLSPTQGAVFAPHIDRIRLKNAMKDVRINLSDKYTNILDDESVTLGTIIGGRKALLLHFWSPWSRECEATLTDFFITADYLASKNVAVASFLPETSAKVISDAKAMLQATGKKIPGAWIIDKEKNPLSIQLKIQSVPAVVLVSSDGAVLFNGHPADEEFWNVLRKINLDIIRPETIKDN